MHLRIVLGFSGAQGWEGVLATGQRYELGAEYARATADHGPTRHSRWQIDRSFRPGRFGRRLGCWRLDG